jgi:hypothetical protein
MRVYLSVTARSTERCYGVSEPSVQGGSHMQFRATHLLDCTWQVDS